MAHIDFREGLHAKPWRVQIRKKGFPQMQQHFATEEEAIKWAEQREGEIEKIRSGSVEIPKVPLSVWISRFRHEESPTRAGRNKEEIFLKFWERELGNKIATSLTPLQIEAVSNILLERKGKNGNTLSIETRRKYLLMLSCIFTTAMIKWKWATHNPISSVDKMKKKSGRAPLEDPDSEEEKEFKGLFCEWVKTRKDLQNLSQRDAAKKCGISLHSFQNATDKNSNPTIKTLIKISTSFGFKIKIEE